jgi:hypothetical protein
MDPKMLAMMMAKKKGMRPPMPSSDMGMRPPAAPMMKKGGEVKKNMGGMAYAKGGGIESRGKTKGTMIKMTRGGMAC